MATPRTVISPVADQLQKGRRELLDLSTRNRLLSVPVGSKTARIINVYDERAEEVYRSLVTDGKALTFVPGKAAPAASIAGAMPADVSQAQDHEEHGIALPQPEDEGGEANAARYTDHKLQTKLSAEALQRRLLDMHYDAATFFEEQGVNILYLAIGQLKWFDAATSDIERFAPLILVPVRLERKTVSQRFRIVWTDEDVAENISLAEKFRTEFGLTLPEFKSGDDFDIQEYLTALQRAVAAQPKWEIRPDAMVLGFFSFAKFLMWRDLDAARWPDQCRIDEHESIKALLGDGFTHHDQLIPEDANVDELLSVPDMRHVVDADSSQALAIECVRGGSHLVIQGPPGTGKSQTITNVIAAAVADGKKVLFVAEKMAALEVVKRRLDNIGLGPLCLELHSNRSTKKHVLDSLRDGWDLGPPVIEQAEKIHDELKRVRSKLNGHAALMHKSVQPSGFTPYVIIGHLVALGQQNVPVSGALFDGAERWSRREFEQKEALIRDIGERIAVIGRPSDHPFRGLQRAGLLRPDLDRIVALASSTHRQLTEVLSTAMELAKQLQLETPAATVAALSQHVTMAQHFAKSPQIDKAAISNSIWTAGYNQLCKLVTAGRRLEKAREQMRQMAVAPVALTASLAEARMAVAAHGGSLFRIFSGDYRRAMAALRSIMTGPPPKDVQERLAILDVVLEAQAAIKEIEAGAQAGRDALGMLWAGQESDWKLAEAALAWVSGMRRAGLAESCLGIYSRVANVPQALETAVAAEKVMATFVATWEELQTLTEFDRQRAFGESVSEQVPLTALHAMLMRWGGESEKAFDWTGYYAKEHAAGGLGISDFVGRMANGEIEPATAREVFRRQYFERLLEYAAREEPALAQFDGRDQDASVASFREYDKRRIDLARAETAAAHYKGLPGGGAGVGPVGVLKGELARKRGHMPIRKLFKQTAPVVQAIKPVFMMSPLSVAQFLEPGAINFDLLVVDEASQVEPVDSLGAIARCRQIVVVGDEKQLPPTRFFMRVTSDVPVDDDEDDGAAKVGDVESVLTLCLAKGLPSRMLRWHYRSRHHSLIAVSNSEFYGNKLFVVPSPHTAAAGSGLTFHHVENGVFDSGGTAVNRVEAQRVADAIIRHARETPDFSLGVATFSLRQREAIRDELELRLVKAPELQAFFDSHPEEPFFIKNLENVQGDERDVIFISVAYGRNTQGYMAMRFGPLSSEGGERRLNVLISRAKRRCEVFSSITADDIDLERAKGRGVAALKIFLSFAKTGRLSIAKRTDREVESPFEESVKRALEQVGYDVHTQIGIAGFFIDLAIAHREFPGRYVLGIECDGVAYHSSKSARDRDRLRQAVLEDHGWIIHRIWSADWFSKPEEQIRKVVDAVEQAKVALKASSAIDKAKATPRTSLRVDFFERGDHETAIATVGRREEPYQEHRFTPPVGRQPHEVSEREMAEIVVGVVTAEGPIHESEVIARVRSNWGLGRAGGRIQQAVVAGLERATTQGRVAEERATYDVPGRPVRVRNRAAVQSSGLRKPDNLPPSEVRCAITNCVRAGMGAKRDEIASDVADAFGFAAVSAQLRANIDSIVGEMLNSGALIAEGEILKEAADRQATVD